MPDRGYLIILRLLLALLLAPSFFVAAVDAGSPPGAGAVVLTPAEEVWLKSHPVVRIAPTPDFPPFEFFDDQGRFSGITADYISIFQRKLGIRFEVVRLSTWEEIVDVTRRGEIDLWGAASETPERAKLMNFTKPYAGFPAVIVVRKGTLTDLSLERLKGLKVVSISRYVTDEFLRERYPQIDRIVVPDAETGLKMVSFGVADVIVLNAAQASYTIGKMGLTNLTVAGQSDVTWPLSFAARREAPELVSILQKALDSLSREERDSITRKWVNLGSSEAADRRTYYAHIATAAAAALLVGLVAFALNRSLRTIVRQRTEELRRSRTELEARTESLMAIHAIADSLYRSLDLDTVAERATEAMMRRSRSLSVAIYLLNEDATFLDMLHAQGFAKTVIPPVRRLPVAGSLSGYAVRERQVVSAFDISTDKRLDSNAKGYLLNLGYRSATCVPLLAEDRVLGVYNLLDQECRILTPAEREELVIIGKTVGLAISNALNINQLRKEMAERLHAEEELREAHDSLEKKVLERTSELAEANERLKELDHLKSMFIASMSHELRTPLNSIIGFTGIILQGMSGELSSRQKQQLTRVYRSAKHLLNLITDVIDISKIEAGKIGVYPEAFPLGEVVKEAAEEVQQQFAEKKLLLQVSITGEALLYTDRKRLLQCLLNFLTNAFKYTEAGEVRLTAHDAGPLLEIAVSDTGIGIAEEDLERLFYPFVRLDSPLKTTVAGTGLGLYLTKKLVVEVLGGTVCAESRQGEGSTFTMRIPKDLPGVSAGSQQTASARHD